MTVSALIELLKDIEHGASGDSREITFRIKGKSYYNIKIDCTGDGCAGAEVDLTIS